MSKVANQVHSNGPDVKSVVYRWEQSWVPMWKRVKVDRKQVPVYWKTFNDFFKLLVNDQMNEGRCYKSRNLTLNASELSCQFKLAMISSIM